MTFEMLGFIQIDMKDIIFCKIQNRVSKMFEKIKKKRNYLFKVNFY